VKYLKGGCVANCQASDVNGPITKND